MISTTQLSESIEVMTEPQPSTQAGEQPAIEQQAITRLKQGNVAGLAVLVEQYQVKAVHAALLIVRDQAIAEDIVQDAFLQAYRKIDQFDERRPFGPWFLRSVINSAIKAAMRQQRTVSLDLQAKEDGLAEWLIHPGPGPEDWAEKTEIREAIWQALEQLTPDQRAAVVLRYYLEEDEQAIVRELGRPLTSIKWWLHAARQRLRKILLPLRATALDGQEVNDEQK